VFPFMIIAPSTNDPPPDWCAVRKRSDSLYETP
jgi:hypothetical protein